HEKPDAASREAGGAGIAGAQADLLDMAEIPPRRTDGANIRINSYEMRSWRIGMDLGQQGAAVADRVEHGLAGARVGEKRHRRRDGWRQAALALRRAMGSLGGLGCRPGGQAEVVGILDAEQKHVALCRIVQNGAALLQLARQPATKLVPVEA